MHDVAGERTKQTAPGTRLWRVVFLAALCAGLAVLLAARNGPGCAHAQAVGFAPPMVMTSALGVARTGE